MSIPPPLAACVAVVESPASRNTATGFARSSRGAACTTNEKLNSDRIPETRILSIQGVEVMEQPFQIGVDNVAYLSSFQNFGRRSSVSGNARWPDERIHSYAASTLYPIA